MIFNKEIKKFFLFLILSFFVYGYYILFPTLNIDGEFDNNFMQTVSLGRWFHALLKKWLLPEPFLPILTPVVAVFFLCLAGDFLVKIYSCSSREKIIAFLIFVSFPQFSYQLEFLNQADTFCIGVFLCTYASFLIIRKKLIGLSFSFCITACALGIYQTLILVMPTVVVVYCSLELWKNKIDIRSSFLLVAKTFFSTVMATVLYLIIQMLFKKYFSINSDGYLFSYLAFNNSFDYFILVCEGVNRLLLKSKFFGGLTFVFVTVGFICLILDVIVGLKKEKILPLLYAVGALFLTLSLIFLSGNASPPRLFVTCSFMMMFVYLICRANFSCKNLIDILAVLIIVFNIAVCNYLFYKDNAVRKSDLYVANRIVSILKENDMDCNNTKMYIHGRLDGVNNLGTSSDTFGKSFFWWDGGNYMRALAFMKYYKVCFAIPANENEVKNISRYIKDMPTWPDKHAVRVIDGIVVVKMSDSFGWLPFNIN